jgi:hypothetical protein
MATLVSTSTLLKLEQVKKAHYQLQLERARVRNHKNVLKLMKICWHRIPKSQPNVMNMEEFQQFYSTLLRGMHTMKLNYTDNDAYCIFFLLLFRNDALMERRTQSCGCSKNVATRCSFTFRSQLRTVLLLLFLLY